MLVGAIAIGLYAYDAGHGIAWRDVDRLDNSVAELQARIDALQEERDAMAARLGSAESALEASEGRYERDVPKGPIKDLAARLAARLADGVDPERLGFVLQHVSQEKSCDDAPQTKRFIIQTAIGTSAGTSVGFGGGAITVTGVGESAADSFGNPLAQFDPGLPVTLLFTTLSGAETRVSGPLPLHHALVDGASEYRFAALPGSPGFVSVTAERCDFP
ncbi:MAG: hypothetical protein EXQ94_00420 [Alphaproteobacteria bacterium]|nr:hypothetical protein [Alphaproteobacteria bacterium]